MKQRLHTILLLFAIVALSMAGTGCVEPLESSTKETLSIPIRIYLPSGIAATKGTETGPVAGSSAESALHQLQIWAFSHPGSADDPTPYASWDDEPPRAYLMVDNLDYSDWESDDGTAKSLTVLMNISMASVKRHPQKLDFYVLGNGHTVGGPLDAGLTRGEIRAKMISDADGFSTTRPVTAPDFGLPMSGFFDNWREGFDIAFLENHTFPSVEDLAEQGIVWPKVDITRAVSRMRFVFAQATGLAAANAIHRIELFDYDQADSESQGVILKETYLFPREPSTPDPWPASPEYQRVSWGGNDYDHALLKSGEIPKIADPRALRSDSQAMMGMSAQYYENFLRGEIANRHAVERVMYLRESDLPIKGKIYYSMGNEEKSATFSMEGLENTTFERNHSWTVYAYFVGNHLEVTVQVLPWDEGPSGEVQTVDPVVVDQDGRFQITKGTVSNGVVTVDDDTDVEGRLIIYAPVGGKLVITPVPVAGTTEEEMNALFEVSPRETVIRARDEYTQAGDTPGEITVKVKRKPNVEKDPSAKKSMYLSFSVQVDDGNGGTRTINADSEVLDDNYYFSTPAKAITSNP